MVEIYNDQWTGDGRAVGQWWIAMDAQDATLYCEEAFPSFAEPEIAPMLIKEAIFCPPEFEGAFWEYTRTAGTPP